MATLTRASILTAAKAVVEELGMEKARVSDVAKRLGTTHAALYKHFKNKDDLFEELTKQWLLTTEAPILEYHTAEPNVIAAHDWLFLLAKTKQANFKRDPKMFMLYTTNVAKSAPLSTWLFNRLWAKAEEVLGVDSPNHQVGHALITAFDSFHNPALSFAWANQDLPTEFEQVWQLVSPALNELTKKN
ncbi:TetR/AcrR family transcriptional regulator [Periweissella cryptocerci]|uniref:TetR/AcrR family transcriptional regulator n=1 Tax=Periweissella cryptocerci TaxID=2506420 RepID=A0A4P6YRI4_9LACO|nr:TetR/AcrR family transcriptional regulator [Periweissella cryptocerci]QBO35226.1 TetR/AcrR family transcriptional regulator [Periweissella cryptocerci]